MDRSGPGLPGAVHAALLAAGGGFWGWFIGGWAPPFRLHDWRYDLAELSVWKQAMTAAVVPWRVEPPLFLTDKFLALPSVRFLPQLALLRWLSLGGYELVHTLLTYGVGYVGTVLLARRRGWGWPAWLLFFLLFNFNGWPASHLGMGHTTLWTGYFALPWFALLALAWAEEGPSVRTALGFALLLWAVSLTGMFHLCAWGALFVLALGARRPAWLPHAVLALAAAAALGAYRLTLGTQGFTGLRLGTAEGYPAVGTLAAALLGRRGLLPAGREPMGWWEYDLHVGPLGLTALLGLGLAPLVPPWRARDGAAARRARLDLPLAATAALACGGLYAALLYALPGFGIERAVTRMLVLPVTVLAALAACRVQELDERLRDARWFRPAAAAALALLAADLVTHAAAWQAPALAAMTTPADIAVPLIVPDAPEAYVGAVKGGWLLSLLALVVVVWLWRRAGRRAQK